MSKRLARINFDPVAGRWTVSDLRSTNNEPLIEEAPGVLVARSVEGVVTELVIETSDDAAPPAEGLRAVTESFGPVAVGVISSGPLAMDAEIVVEIPPETLATTTDRTPLIGELGIPVAQTDGTYLVPHHGTDIRLVLGRDSLVITVRKSTRDGQNWVIVSEAETGGLLAIGQLRDIDGGTQSATVTFGLPIAPENLHVTVGSDPLEPIAQRDVRRRRWARDLLESARRASAFRPSRCASDAAAAARVGAAVGDQAVVAEADALMKRARRRRFGLLVLVAVALAASVSGFLVAGLIDDPSPTDPVPAGSVFYENCDAARAAGPTPLVEGQPGYRAGLDRDSDGKACE